jgi:type II secretory pathway pseudopilin PulG
MSRRQAGFSVVELLVVTVLVGLLFVATLPVLDELIRSIGQSGGAIAAGNFGEAAVRLRGDVHAAQGVTAPSTEWTAAPLELHLADGTTARYGQVGRGLVRELFAEARPPLRTTVLGGVTGWQWRSDGRLVDVRVDHSVNATSGLTAGRAGTAQHEFLRLGLRGLGGGRW